MTLEFTNLLFSVTRHSSNQFSLASLHFFPFLAHSLILIVVSDFLYFSPLAPRWAPSSIIYLTSMLSWLNGSPFHFLLWLYLLLSIIFRRYFKNFRIFFVAIPKISRFFQYSQNYSSFKVLAIIYDLIFRYWKFCILLGISPLTEKK